ncbi:interleukin-2 receptor subunit beta [Centropristis striata]|uniref:interleukin-2 receptor subunit beta n=1 Tax=Centropristis striata TaxID=184440 RepID=UPI0027E20A2A|nr:interleukin-2 receptor subunit beta [Centropristis striata]
MSHIVVMAVEVLVSLCVLVALSSVHAAHSHKGSQGLSCVNDFINNVSCTWNSSRLAPGVDCTISGVMTTWVFKDHRKHRKFIKQSCKLKQHRHSPPGCSFVFENETFNPFKNMPYISMECNGTSVENITNYSPYDHIKMHPPGAPNVSCTANETTISWSQGSRPSDFFESFYFQAQIKQKKQAWNEVSNLPTGEQELSFAASKLKGHLQVRVRVKPTVQTHNSHWSDWSPTTSWVGATDTETSQDQEWTSLVIRGVMFSLCLMILTLVVYWSCVSRGLLKGKQVPNPSKYFHTLHSVHEGNLKKWLNPLSASESFFITQPSDRISPVEVCESWDVVPSTSPSSSSTSALLHFRSYPLAASDTSGVVDNSSSSSSSCFSNMGYFMSSSSGSSVRTDPNPVYFTYQDDFRHQHSDSHNLHLSLSLCASLDASRTYESLKREPQSPDSGFGKEDEESKENKRVEDVEVKKVSDHHQSPPLLILPLHLPPRMSPCPSAPPLPDAPCLSPTSSDSQQVDVAVAAGGSYTAWPTAGAMCRSSSMPVEPCKTGYLTLKELQTTFSNKSI